jgi:large subunit ribosomal protein L35
VRASSSASSSFEPAIPAGADPAYDLALAYLEEQNAASRARADKLKATAGPTPTPEQAARITRAQVEAYVNDPATRRAFAATGGSGQMDKPVMRHLAHRRWRKEGELDLVMQRVNQLGVVPDLIPDHVPIASIRVAGAQGAIVPGAVVPATELAGAPQLTVQLFEHPETPSDATPVPEALYTLLVVDPDSPNHETHSYTERLHYAKSDIPLSVVSGQLDLLTAPGTEHLAYEPIAPAQGSGKHRLVFLVVRQRAPVAAPTSRDDFSVRAFLTDSGVTAEDVVAASVVRSEWTPETAQHIDATYEAHRGAPAPVYGKPPKEFRYGYPLSAKAQQREGIRQAAYENIIAEIEAMQQGQIPGEPETQQ